MMPITPKGRDRYIPIDNCDSSDEEEDSSTCHNRDPLNIIHHCCMMAPYALLSLGFSVALLVYTYIFCVSIHSFFYPDNE